MPTTQTCHKLFWKDYLQGASETLDLVLDKVSVNNPFQAPHSLRVSPCKCCLKYTNQALSELSGCEGLPCNKPLCSQTLISAQFLRQALRDTCKG